MKDVRLTAAEWRLIASIREIPDGALRDLFEGTLGRLADAVQEPRCSEMQADGVPCDTAVSDCEHCVNLRELLESIQRSLDAR